MRQYHPEECIFDLIASSGPQHRYEVLRECSAQCTTSNWLEGTTSEERYNSALDSLHVLVLAGLIEFDGDAYDLTDYGYIVLSCYSDRQREYEAHRRATLG